MDVDVKMEIQVVLEMLNKVLVENGVSMATTMNGDLCFFDMETYLEKSKFDGFKVNIKELVKLGVNMTESDLIRREDVIKLVNQFVFGLCKAQNDEVIKIFNKYVEKIPTAYSVDKVVEELEETMQDLSVIEIFSHIDFDSTIQSGLDNFLKAYNSELLRIVNQGGVSDDVCEWKVKSNYYVTECSHDTDVMYGLKQDFKFCPYCSKKIKVVE